MSKKQMPERDIEIFGRIHGGKSFAEESRRTGLSVTRVRQIFHVVSRRLGICGSTSAIREANPDLQLLTVNHLSGREKLYMLSVLSQITGQPNG